MYCLSYWGNSAELMYSLWCEVSITISGLSHSLVIHILICDAGWEMLLVLFWLCCGQLTSVLGLRHPFLIMKIVFCALFKSFFEHCNHNIKVLPLTRHLHLWYNPLIDTWLVCTFLFMYNWISVGSPLWHPSVLRKFWFVELHKI